MRRIALPVLLALAACSSGTGATGPQGAPGPQGPAGPAGPTGPAGAGVAVATEPAGEHCASGGIAVSDASGLHYVCNGTGGSGGAQNAILNQTGVQEGANFGIDGSGFLGGDLRVVGTAMFGDVPRLRTLSGSQSTVTVFGDVDSFGYSVGGHPGIGQTFRVKGSADLTDRNFFHFTSWGQVSPENVSDDANTAPAWSCTQSCPLPSYGGIDLGNQVALSAVNLMLGPGTATRILLQGSNQLGASTTPPTDWSTQAELHLEPMDTPNVWQAFPVRTEAFRWWRIVVTATSNETHAWTLTRWELVEADHGVAVQGGIITSFQ